MLVVKVELYSAITGKITEIARMMIYNEGGPRTLGDYGVAVYRGRDEDTLNKKTVIRRAKVKNHPRLREHVWNLVTKALVAAGYKEPAPSDLEDAQIG